ncbi:MAG: hypothetical protein BM549_07050, partial [Lacinutrix sp. MedPE-SW]
MKRILLSTLFFIFSFISFAQQPNDCANALTVCGDSDVVLDVNGPGNNSNEFPNSCQSNENNSLWLEVTVTTTGTLAFTLTPNSTNITEDYDFFIFGPNTTCGNLGPTIRCSTTNPQSSGQANNLTGLSTSETDNFEGPGAAGNSFVSAINANAGDTYFIVIDRPIGNSPFSLTWTGTAQFADAPISQTPPFGNGLDLTECDSVAPFNDGQTLFNLEENTPLIIGSQSNVAVAYYESESNATIASSPLTSPYTSNNNGQTIYATITNTSTGCFSIVDFQLLINNNSTTGSPSNLELCDDSSNDGVEIFDLTTEEAVILNGQDPANYTVSYYEQPGDVATSTNAITTPEAYPNMSSPQTIYVRVDDNSNPTCFGETSFTITVNP